MLLDMLTGGEITVVAMYAVIGDVVVERWSSCAGGVVHVALKGPAELLGAVEVRNVALAVQIAQFRSTVCPWPVALLSL